jgi:hypothetical protein
MKSLATTIKNCLALWDIEIIAAKVVNLTMWQFGNLTLILIIIKHEFKRDKSK